MRMMKSPIEEFCLAVELQLTRANRREMVVLLGELREHLEDKQGALMARGMEETQAAREAVAAMGDPAEIGRELGKLYDPLWLWLDRLVLGLLVWLLFWGIFLGIEYLSIFMGEWGRP